ncbi:DEAD/DEAH box helicase [Candidatus Dependentiae bacterium]|nr:MAG: DEAD/DEAH box helicase [Candidatus Dependentiae bacterium]
MKIFKRSDLHKYQRKAVKFILKKLKCGLFLDMGLGKTATTLTAISDLLDEFRVSNVLIVAPLKVANNVWKQETRKWEHLRHLKVRIATGSEKRRLKQLRKPADIHIINRENIPWLIENVKWKWDMLVIDESSSFKSAKARRFRSLRKVLKYLESVVILTGTPSPQSFMDLWSQIFLLDLGKRLGKTITSYRQKYFRSFGYMSYQFKIKQSSIKKIKKLISDICISMKAEDYLDLPEKIFINEYVDLPAKNRKQYKEIKKEFLLKLKKDIYIESPSTSAVMNKLLQICNGSIYDNDRKAHILHKAKIERLKEIMEDNPDENFFVAYNYKTDLKMLKKAFPEAVVLSRDGREIKDWNKGKIKMLLVHPASAGHGLNAQYGGCVAVWYGLNWSLELYQQFNARLHRQGQLKPVRIIHIVVKNSVDEDVLKALESKAKTQDELIDYLRFELKKSQI